MNLICSHFLVQLANQNFNEMNSEGPLSSNLPANSVIKIDNAYHQKCFINCEIHNLFILQLGKQILQQEHICNHL